jgi:hypothetical protein
MSKSMSKNKLGMKIMTKQLQIYCTIVMSAVIVIVASPAVAQDEEKERPRPPARGGLLAALDSNSDGEIDSSEIDLAVVSLKKLDKDGDGKISREELGSGARREGSGQRPGSDRPQFDLSALDKDGDGKISKEEAPERMRERFDRMDRNDDGFIDKEEQEAIMRFIRERGKQGGGNGAKRRPNQGDGDGGSEKPKRPAIDDE